jgi:hypothetical protein
MVKLGQKLLLRVFLSSVTNAGHEVKLVYKLSAVKVGVSTTVGDSAFIWEHTM